MVFDGAGGGVRGRGIEGVFALAGAAGWRTRWRFGLVLIARVALVRRVGLGLGTLAGAF
jgi:hypothetical protein